MLSVRNPALRAARSLRSENFISKKEAAPESLQFTCDLCSPIQNSCVLPWEAARLWAPCPKPLQFTCDMCWPIQNYCVLRGTLAVLSLNHCNLHAIRAQLCTASGGGPLVGKLYFRQQSRPKTIAIYIRCVLGRFKSVAFYMGLWAP